MNERTSLIQEYLPWLYAGALSLWGAAVHIAQKFRAGEEFRGRDLVIDSMVCVFAGSIAFYLCQWQQMDGWFSAVAISLSAHSGPRAIGLYLSVHDRVIGGIK